MRAVSEFQSLNRESVMETARPRAAATKASRHQQTGAVAVTSVLLKELVELLAAGPIIVSCHALTNIATNTSQPITLHHEYSC
jgi:hypothetical protein